MSGDGGGQLEELSTLKKASGGSSIRSNEKYEKTFDFVNEAALFFSANEPPRFAEEKASVKDRLYPIQMPYRFVSDPDPDNPKEKQKVPGISKQLLNDDAAMRGLLRLAVEHAQDLIERNGEYSMPEGPEERFESYTVEADPIVRFARMAFEQGSAGDRVSKEDAYHVYRQVMDIWRERTTSEDSFKRYLPRCVSAEVETSRSRALAGDADERVRVWKRLKWTEDAAEFMPDWIAERYSDQFDDADTADTSDTEDDGPTALPARDPGYGHEFDVTVSVVNDGEYTREAQGRLEGPQGLYISYVVPGGNDIEMSAYEHSTVHMDSVTLRTNDDGLLEAVISDAVTVERIGVSPETDTDDDADGDSTETDTETTETTETPDGPSDETQDTAAADGGRTPTEDDADETDETDETDDETAEMLTPDGLDKSDPNAPESQKRRIFKIKAKLRAAGTGDRNDFVTADDLADELGWDRDIIDATIEKLRRESNAMFGTPEKGWQMSD
jgi:putative DNA primase/helicase